MLLLAALVLAAPGTPKPILAGDGCITMNTEKLPLDKRVSPLDSISFKVEKSDKIGDVFVAQWVATAPFLAEPYKGSDAYITKDGYMQAMVSTFDGGALKMKK